MVARRGDCRIAHLASIMEGLGSAQEQIRGKGNATKPTSAFDPPEAPAVSL